MVRMARPDDSTPPALRMTGNECNCGLDGLVNALEKVVKLRDRLTDGF
jgi:hypothetical protein